MNKTDKVAPTVKQDNPRTVAGQWWSGKISESDVNRIASYLEQCGLDASNRNIAFQHCKETLSDFKDETAVAFYNLLDAAQGF